MYCCSSVMLPMMGTLRGPGGRGERGHRRLHMPLRIIERERDSIIKMNQVSMLLFCMNVSFFARG